MIPGLWIICGLSAVGIREGEILLGSAQSAGTDPGSRLPSARDSRSETHSPGSLPGSGRHPLPGSVHFNFPWGLLKYPEPCHCTGTGSLVGRGEGLGQRRARGAPEAGALAGQQGHEMQGFHARRVMESGATKGPPPPSSSWKPPSFRFETHGKAEAAPQARHGRKLPGPPKRTLPRAPGRVIPPAQEGDFGPAAGRDWVSALLGGGAGRGLSSGRFISGAGRAALSAAAGRGVEAIKGFLWRTATGNRLQALGTGSPGVDAAGEASAGEGPDVSPPCPRSQGRLEGDAEEQRMPSR